MALDATVGGASANSFLTNEEAVALAADHPYGSAWAGYTNQDALLIGATKILVRLCFLGTASSETQRLPFPRTSLLTRNGFPLDPATIPSEIKEAQFELALMLGESDISRGSDAAAEGITKLKAGPVELTFADPITQDPVPSNVKQLLVPSWLCPTTMAKTITFMAS